MGENVANISSNIDSSLSSANSFEIVYLKQPNRKTNVKSEAYSEIIESMCFIQTFAYLNYILCILGSCIPY